MVVVVVCVVVVDEPVLPVVPPPPALLPVLELEPWEPVVLVVPPELLETEVLVDDVDDVLVVLVCWVNGSRPWPGKCENWGVVLSSTTGRPEIGEVMVAPAPVAAIADSGLGAGLASNTGTATSAPTRTTTTGQSRFSRRSVMRGCRKFIESGRSRRRRA